MPSPGRSAIFTTVEDARRWTLCEPRFLRQMLRLERSDLARVLERQGDFVQPVLQAALAEGLDVEAEHMCAIGRGHRLPRQVDGERKPRERRGVVEQTVDLVFRQDD